MALETTKVSSAGNCESVQAEEMLPLRSSKTYGLKVHPLEVGVMCYEEMPELKQCPVSSALKKHKV